MPIGDLLAQISGGEASSSSSKPSPTPSLQRSNTLPKRKADGELSSDAPKAARITTLSSTVAPRSTPAAAVATAATADRSRQIGGGARPTTSQQPSRPLDRPNAQKPVNGSASRSSVLSSKPMNGANKVTKPAALGRPSPGPTATSAATTAPGPKATPKKGSFAAIMARGQRAQAVMGQVGKIQHKRVEKGPAAKRDGQEPPSKPEPRYPKMNQPAGAGYSGTSKPGQRNGPSNNGALAGARSKDPRGAAMVDRTKGDRAKAAAEEERQKKLKKAAVATTGYTGTARPVSSAAAKKRDAPRGGALLAVPAPRPRHSKTSGYEDGYDEDMDDFIDYDDEEEGGPRYGYASDVSSDMEAGMDDIDDEEQRALRIARQEDIEEQRLEKQLKEAKEARKRQTLQGMRGGRR